MGQLRAMRFIATGARIELDTQLGVVHLEIPDGHRIEVTTESRDGSHPVHVIDGKSPLIRSGIPSFSVALDAVPVLGAGTVRSWITDGPDLNPSR
jgi:hypothetical protein